MLVAFLLVLERDEWEEELKRSDKNQLVRGIVLPRSPEFEMFEMFEMDFCLRFIHLVSRLY